MEAKPMDQEPMEQETMDAEAMDDEGSFGPGFMELVTLLDDELTPEDLKKLIQLVRGRLLKGFGKPPEDDRPSVFLYYLANQRPEGDCIHIIRHALAAMNYHSAWHSQRLADYIENNVYTGAEEIVGREKPIKELVNICKDQNYKGIWLHGMGGLGKTTIVNETCERLHHYLGMEILHVHLSRLKHTDQVLKAILECLQVAPVENDPELLARQILHSLRIRTAKAILVLDSVEEAYEAGMTQGLNPRLNQGQGQNHFINLIEQLIDARNNVTLIVTSRVDSDGTAKLSDNQLQTRPIFAGRMLEVQLQPLAKKDAKKLIQVLSKQHKLDDGKLGRLADYCKCLPHALKQVSRTTLDDDDDDNPNICYRRVIRISTNSIIEYVFNRLSNEAQEQVIMLSVFETNDFDIRDVTAILGLNESDATRALMELVDRCLIKIVRTKSVIKDYRYIFHQIDWEFLDKKKNTADLNCHLMERISTADIRFCELFMRKVHRYVDTFDTDFQRALQFIVRNPTRSNAFFRIVCSGNELAPHLSVSENITLAHIPGLYLPNDEQVAIIERLIQRFKNRGEENKALFWLIEKGKLLMKAEENESAERLLDDSRLSVEALQDGDLILIGTRYYATLGRCKRRVGKYPDALDALQKARVLNENNTDVAMQQASSANIMNTIGNIYFQMKNYDESLRFHRLAVEILERQLGDTINHELSTFVFNIGTIAHAKAEYVNSLSCDGDIGQFEEALQYFDRSIAYDKKLKIDHNTTFAEKLVIKSKTLKRLKRFEEAESCLIEALQVQKEMYGDYHMKVTLVYHQLGELHVKWREKIASTRKEHLILAMKYYGDAEKCMIEGGFLHGDLKLKFIKDYERFGQSVENKRYKKRVNEFCMVLSNHDDPNSETSESEDMLSTSSGEDDHEARGKGSFSDLSDAGIEMDDDADGQIPGSGPSGSFQQLDESGAVTVSLLTMSGTGAKKRQLSSSDSE